VGLSHPLNLTPAAIRSGRTPLLELRLGPMTGEDVLSLVAATLVCPPDVIRPLASLVCAMTSDQLRRFARYIPDVTAVLRFD
jgi:predicted ATPase